MGCHVSLESATIAAACCRVKTVRQRKKKPKRIFHVVLRRITRLVRWPRRLHWEPFSLALKRAEKRTFNFTQLYPLRWSSLSWSTLDILSVGSLMTSHQVCIGMENERNVITHEQEWFPFSPYHVKFEFHCTHLAPAKLCARKMIIFSAMFLFCFRFYEAHWNGKVEIISFECQPSQTLSPSPASCHPTEYHHASDGKIIQMNQMRPKSQIMSESIFPHVHRAGIFPTFWFSCLQRPHTSHERKLILSIQSIKNEKVSSLSILWINSILAHIFLYIRSINVKLKTLSWLKIERWSALIRCDKQVMLKKIDENKMMNFSHAHNLLENPPCNRSKENFVFCLLVYSVELSTGYVWHDKTSKLLEKD